MVHKPCRDTNECSSANLLEEVSWDKGKQLRSVSRRAWTWKAKEQGKSFETMSRNITSCEERTPRAKAPFARVPLPGRRSNSTWFGCASPCYIDQEWGRRDCRNAKHLRSSASWITASIALLPSQRSPSQHVHRNSCLWKFEHPLRYQQVSCTCHATQAIFVLLNPPPSSNPKYVWSMDVALHRAIGWMDLFVSISISSSAMLPFLETMVLDVMEKLCVGREVTEVSWLHAGKQPLSTVSYGHCPVSNSRRDSQSIVNGRLAAYPFQSGPYNCSSKVSIEICIGRLPQ
jgi:hypothetical protein